MKKTMLSLGVFALLGLSTQVLGQAVVDTATPSESLKENAVGINTNDPTATLDVDGGARVRKARAAVLPESKVKATEILVVDKDGNLLRLPISTTTLQELVGSTSGSGTQPGAASNTGVVDKNFKARFNQKVTTDYDWTNNGEGLVNYYEFTSKESPFSLPDPKKHQGAIIHFKNSIGGSINYGGEEGINYPMGTTGITGSSAQIVWSDGNKWYLIGGRN
ncbi:hypothetical protein ACQ1Q1_02350 [Ornithobacterium rhinotracheale]|uniref:Uncharacterized protein n=1 Tax=Ornithobacterium rhinotracheale (strain ATCC 51463 / DSM 15997 / CCUG 23171 / CIP 104009 / LMG 9086) TaxID=867902 RepID=I4A1Y2_ORNRL|nr:hypothetical protein [Ornithobacterium rhinotracheale]AFL97966.1 hypothetical protein Ornrh_1816 [Ornithobacterium rhinotracheale DSM 15997]AIP99763.1 hypothetical protein Q785_08920 [Ornithobacterium rhinotracheale ORT-UMN 88]MBN3661624.1 hypothetical protein [Ornithobacterium rhinotracheale]MCK0193744.1 hypothetical protein [Ornithobacterium rhinotracheale]MCK0202181.1 hypothetical protein [Ornithobacterium rhinotracheale]